MNLLNKLSEFLRLDPQIVSLFYIWVWKSFWHSGCSGMLHFEQRKTVRRLHSLHRALGWSPRSIQWLRPSYCKQTLLLLLLSVVKALVLYTSRTMLLQKSETDLSLKFQKLDIFTLSDRVAKQASRQPRPDIREWPVGDGLEKMVDVMERSLANLNERMTAVELNADRAGRTQ